MQSAVVTVDTYDDVYANGDGSVMAYVMVPYTYISYIQICVHTILHMASVYQHSMFMH